MQFIDAPSPNFDARTGPPDMIVVHYTGKPEDLDADRTKIRDYMAKLEGFPGLGGPIGFNDDGDAIKAFYVLQGQNGAWDSKVRGCSAAPGHPGC